MNIKATSALLCLLTFGCGAKATSVTKTPSTTPAAAAAPAPALPTRSEMLAAFPAQTTIVFGIDVEKLRKSPIAQHAWEAVRGNDKAANLIDPLCGAEADVRYALIGMSSKTEAAWVWIDGIPRSATLKCAKAREQNKANPHKEVTHGDYTLSTSEKSVTEMLWVGDHTALVVVRTGTEPPVGEPALRAAVEKRAGLTPETPVGALVDHIDFNSGISFAIDGRMMPTARAQGVAMSVELDDALRAQVFVQFADEDHASDLRAEYRKLIDAALQKHVIDSGDTRVSGNGMAASVTMTNAQVEWLVDAARKYAAGQTQQP